MSLRPVGSPTELVIEVVIELATEELPTELVLTEWPRGVGYSKSSGKAVRRRILGPTLPWLLLSFALPFKLST